MEAARAPPPPIDSLPPEMLCRIVSLFQTRPSEWKSLLLTSRTMAGTVRDCLDPASDRVRSGGAARSPTLAARLVEHHAAAIPMILDTYRRANASALLVQACRLHNIRLIRTLVAHRHAWRVDVGYRHNRALLQCARLGNAVGMQLLLGTGDVDPTDHPGAAHLGRCLAHESPACRRPDHPGPCDACARGEQHGLFADSDTDTDDDPEDQVHNDGDDDDDGGGDEHEGGAALDDERLSRGPRDDDDGGLYDPRDVDVESYDPFGDDTTTEEEEEEDRGDDDASGRASHHAGQAGGALAPPAAAMDGGFGVDFDDLFDVDDDDDDDDDDEDYIPLYDGPMHGGGGGGGDDDDDYGNGVRADPTDDGAGALWREAVTWDGAVEEAASDARPHPTVLPMLPLVGQGRQVLVARRTAPAHCVCRTGATFAIAWIDEDGNEVAGRSDDATRPVWFLSCEEPEALAVDGPLAFLVAPQEPHDPHETPGDATATATGDDDDDDGAPIEPITEGDLIPVERNDDGDAEYDGGSPHVGASTVPMGDTTEAAEPEGDPSDKADAISEGPPLPNVAEVEDPDVGNNVASDAQEHASEDDGHHGNHLRAAYIDLPPCTCAHGGRPTYTRGLERWCPLFYAAVMSVGVLGQLVAYVSCSDDSDDVGGSGSSSSSSSGMPKRRWACNPADVLMLAAAQIIAFSSASQFGALADVHAASIEVMLAADALDLSAHGEFLLAFAADRGCSGIVEVLTDNGADSVDVSANGDLALRRALWRYVRLYRPVDGVGSRLSRSDRSNRMCLYGATLVALALAAGIDTRGMEPNDAHVQPLDVEFVRALARRTYPGLEADDIGRLRLPPLRPHYPPPFVRPRSGG